MGRGGDPRREDGNARHGERAVMKLVARVLAAATLMSHVLAAESSVPVPALLRECSPFAEELMLALGSHAGGAEEEGASKFVLRGRQALIFGAGSHGPSIVKFVGRQHTAAKPEALQRPFVESCRREVFLRLRMLPR
ncbi:MAG: hypothetical protein ACPIOQ_36205, partial [Promethearchaeia archaeon]